MGQVDKSHSTGIVGEKEQVAGKGQSRRRQLQGGKFKDHFFLHRTFTRFLNTGMNMAEKHRNRFHQTFPDRTVQDGTQHTKKPAALSSFPWTTA